MKKLAAARFALANGNREVWQARVEPGTTLDEMLEPSFWAHVAGKIDVRGFGSKIEVIAEDGSFYAELLVTYSTMREIRAVKLHWVDLERTDPLSMPDAPYIAEHKGFGKWRVLRTSDRTVARDGFNSKEDAQRWIDSHVKALAA